MNQSMSVIYSGYALAFFFISWPVAELFAGETPDAPGPGDYRGGYQESDFRTQSRSVEAAGGVTIDLTGLVASPPIGLPAVPVPANNPITEAGVRLGRKLFFDRRLSPNNTLSCAMCHVPEHGFTHNEMQTSIGIEGRTVRRNAPTIYNVAYLQRLFVDGRETSLETQVWSPLLAINEMGNPSVGAVIERIESFGDYSGMFEEAFDRGPGMETIGMALANYQRTLLAGDSAFDKWNVQSDKSAISESALNGFRLFTGKAGCSRCHLATGATPLFTDNRFHNSGLGYRASTVSRAGRRALPVAPGETLNIDTSSLDSVGGQRPGDLGLYELTGQPEDRWRYRTPSLRNVAVTGPYMHDGSLASLNAVIHFYNQGGIPNEGLDPLLQPLNLNDEEIAALVAFLETLTGGNIGALVGDALAAPVGGG
jgi:cytochrome c peroxidase